MEFCSGPIICIWILHTPIPRKNRMRDGLCNISIQIIVTIKNFINLFLKAITRPNSILLGLCSRNWMLIQNIYEKYPTDHINLQLSQKLIRTLFKYYRSMWIALCKKLINPQPKTHIFSLKPRRSY